MSPIRASSKYGRVIRSPRTSFGSPNVIPPPIGGWNTRDNLAELPASDSPLMDNWFPGFGSVSLRSGFTSYSTGLGGAVQFLTEFNMGSTRKLIAGANGNLWDASTAGAATSLAAGFASNKWMAVQFDDFAGGARLGLVAAGNTPQIYNGTAVSAMTISGSGLTVTTLGGIHAHKSRTYFWDPNTQDFWYSSVGALGGVLAKFPLGRVQGSGGTLVAIGTWSRDGGTGPDDYAVFLMSSGDVFVYAGSNPGDSTDWGLVGHYNIGVPITSRGVKKVGSEVLVLTRAGYVPLMSLVTQGRYSEQSGAISNKIRGAAVQAAQSSGDIFGWDILHYPRSSMLIVNVPVSTTQFCQHVMNTETGAWCRFTGMNAYSWSLLNERPYFGGNGTVYRFDSGTSDNGSPITWAIQTNWDYLGQRRASKRMTAIKPIIRCEGSSTDIRLGISSDFKDVLRKTTIRTPVASGGTLWDVGDWDTFDWGSDGAFSDKWLGVNASGFAMSVLLQGSTTDNSFEWLTTQYQLENGGRL